MKFYSHVNTWNSSIYTFLYNIISTTFTAFKTLNYMTDPATNMTCNSNNAAQNMCFNSTTRNHSSENYQLFWYTANFIRSPTLQPTLQCWTWHENLSNTILICIPSNTHSIYIYIYTYFSSEERCETFSNFTNVYHLVIKNMRMDDEISH